jgi:hypothetical protein
MRYQRQEKIDQDGENARRAEVVSREIAFARKIM